MRLIKTLMQMSQELLKCLRLVANYFFSKSSCCVFAQKLISLVKICVDSNTIGHYVQAITSTMDQGRLDKGPNASSPELRHCV